MSSSQKFDAMLKGKKKNAFYTVVLLWVSTISGNRFSIRYWQFKVLWFLRFPSLARRYSLIKNVSVNSKKFRELSELFSPTHLLTNPKITSLHWASIFCLNKESQRKFTALIFSLPVCIWLSQRVSVHFKHICKKIYWLQIWKTCFHIKKNCDALGAASLWHLHGLWCPARRHSFRWPQAVHYVKEVTDFVFNSKKRQLGCRHSQEQLENQLFKR